MGTVADSPGATSGTVSCPVTRLLPSSSTDQSNRRWDRPAKSCRLSIRTAPSAPLMRTGSMTFLYSSSPGDGVRSGNSKPSATKLPSCSGSPKSPPYPKYSPRRCGARIPWSIHSQMNPPWQRGYASNSSWYSLSPPGPLPMACRTRT